MRVLLAVLAFLAACGPAAGEIRKARETEYRADALPKVLAGIREVMHEHDYTIAVDDAAAGIVISTWGRQAHADGTLLFFRIGVQLHRGPRGGYLLRVDGEARDDRLTWVAAPYEHGDPDEPTWVRGRIDNLTYALYEKLAPLAI